MMLLKLPGLRKLSALNEKKVTMTTSPISTGQLPRFPARMLSRIRPKKLWLHGLLAGGRSAGAHDGSSGAVDGNAGHLRRHAGRDRLDDLLLGRRLALVEGDRPAEPQNGDPVATSKTSCRLCEIEDDREPLVGEAVDELEHLLGLRDAERGGRLVEDHEARVPHHRAGDGDRLPLAAGERGHRLADRANRGHREALHRLGRLGLHDRLLEPLEHVVGLAAEIHVLDDVEVVAERKILVDDLDPELRRVLRPVDVHDLAVEHDVAAVRRVDAGDALDQGRLAGAVVSDEGHHLSGPDLELDFRERLHRAEALRDPVKLEQRCGCRGTRHGWKGRWGRHEDGPTLVVS